MPWSCCCFSESVPTRATSSPGPDQISSYGELWCSPGGQNLFSSHKERLLCQIKNGWLDDALVTAAMMLVKKETDEFGGLQPPTAFYGYNRRSAKERLRNVVRLREYVFADDFALPKGRQVQILFTGSNHWVLVSNCHEHERELVYVYDSDDGLVTDLFIAKIAAVFRFTSAKFRIVWPRVDRQKNNRDCGIFAIAFLFALCHHLDPSDLKLDTSMKLREHLVRCFEQGSLSLTDLFPTRHEEANNQLSLLGKFFNFLSQSLGQARRRALLHDRVVYVVCRCRLPVGKGRRDPTVICSNPRCSMPLYHKSCVFVFDKEFYSRVKSSQWTCPPCRDFLLGC